MNRMQQIRPNNITETKLLTRREVMAWVVPEFQRPVKVNEKVKLLALELQQNGGVIEGVITLGKLLGSSALYIVDGQHRREAFLISDCEEVISDVRIITFPDMAAMAEAFVKSQERLRQMRPDDVLRGLESAVPALARLRRECQFVGYDQIRRGTNSPIASAALMVKSWAGSRAETPTANAGGRTAVDIIKEMDEEELGWLIEFLNLANEAWGRDPENGRLWNSLNIGICMWLFRRLVIDQDRRSKRCITLINAQFCKCIRSLSADGDYIDWLGGRSLTDHHRMPCYRRIRSHFVARLREEIGKTALMPNAAWVTN